jgi:regulator of ribonuclease activity A
VTADLIDEFGAELSSCETQFRAFGRLTACCGPVSTIRCHEDNQLVREAVASAGDGRVLVIDGGGSLRAALVGDLLAGTALANGWSGIVVHGAIRDSVVVDELDLAVKALGTNPRKSAKTGAGERDVPVDFGGVRFVPDYWLWSDEDGIVLAERDLLAGRT